jgi:hypothetical protein
VLAKNPLVGARVKNTTRDAKHLLEGPITVFLDSRYAGDARIDNLPPGQERLISYGIDLEVNVVSDEAPEEQTSIRTARVDRGVLAVTRKEVYTHKYRVENKSANDKTLLLEHRKNAGRDPVVTPKPVEETEEMYRFKEKLAGGASRTIQVKEEVVLDQTLDLRQIDTGNLLYYSNSAEIPEKVRKALDEAIQMRHAVADLERRIKSKETELAKFPADQARIRENMKVVDKSSDYYSDLLKRLRTQEGQIEQLNTDLLKLRADLEGQQKKLQDYLEGLTI